jgi:hypothetical protein
LLQPIISPLQASHGAACKFMHGIESYFDGIFFCFRLCFAVFEGITDEMSEDDGRLKAREKFQRLVIVLNSSN